MGAWRPNRRDAQIDPVRVVISFFHQKFQPLKKKRARSARKIVVFGSLFLF